MKVNKTKIKIKIKSQKKNQKWRVGMDRNRVEFLVVKNRVGCGLNTGQLLGIPDFSGFTGLWWGSVYDHISTYFHSFQPKHQTTTIIIFYT